jgi:hypothetical protein
MHENFVVYDLSTFGASIFQANTQEWSLMRGSITYMHYTDHVTHVWAEKSAIMVIVLLHEFEQ